MEGIESAVVLGQIVYLGSIAANRRENSRTVDLSPGQVFSYFGGASLGPYTNSINQSIGACR